MRGLGPSEDARGRQAKQVPSSLGAASPPPSAAASASRSACAGDSSSLRSLGGDDGAACSKQSAVGVSSATRGEATAPGDPSGDSASLPARLMGGCSSGGVSQDSAAGADELRRTSLGEVGAHALVGCGLVAAGPGGPSSSEEVKSSAAGAQRPPLSVFTLVIFATVLPQPATPWAMKPKNPRSCGGAIGSAASVRRAMRQPQARQDQRLLLGREETAGRTGGAARRAAARGGAHPQPPWTTQPRSPPGLLGPPLGPGEGDNRQRPSRQCAAAVREKRECACATPPCRAADAGAPRCAARAALTRWRRRAGQLPRRVARGAPGSAERTAGWRGASWCAARARGGARLRPPAVRSGTEAACDAG